jgi:hypothetical protein
VEIQRLETAASCEKQVVSVYSHSLTAAVCWCAWADPLLLAGVHWLILSRATTSSLGTVDSTLQSLGEIRNNV